MASLTAGARVSAGVTSGGTGADGAGGATRRAKISISPSTSGAVSSSPHQVTRYSFVAGLNATAGLCALKLVLPSGPICEILVSTPISVPLAESRCTKISNSPAVSSSPHQVTRYSFSTPLNATAGSRALKLVLPSGPHLRDPRVHADLCADRGESLHEDLELARGVVGAPPGDEVLVIHAVERDRRRGLVAVGSSHLRDPRVHTDLCTARGESLHEDLELARGVVVAPPGDEVLVLHAC